MVGVPRSCSWRTQMPDDRSGSSHDLSPLIVQQVFHSLIRARRRPRGRATPTSTRRIAAWEAEPPVRAIFESGARQGRRARRAGRHLRAALRRAGRRRDDAAARSTSSRRLARRRAADRRQRGRRASSSIPRRRARHPRARRQRVGRAARLRLARSPTPGRAVVFESAPLTVDRGHARHRAASTCGSRSPVDDADLEVNLTEVRPDGQEMYVQSGWLRASLRQAGPRRDRAVAGDRPSSQGDWAPLVPGAWTQVRVGIAGFQHVFRAGSRIRVLGRHARRQPRRVALRAQDVHRHGHAHHRPRRDAPVERGAAARARRDGADAAAGLPVAARPAVPRLRAVHQPRRELAREPRAVPNSGSCLRNSRPRAPLCLSRAVFRTTDHLGGYPRRAESADTEERWTFVKSGRIERVGTGGGLEGARRALARHQRARLEEHAAVGGDCDGFTRRQGTHARCGRGVCAATTAALSNPTRS